MKVIGTTNDGNPMVELDALDREAIRAACALLGSFPVVPAGALPGIKREIEAAGQAVADTYVLPAPARKKPGPKPKAQRSNGREERKCLQCGCTFIPRRKDQKCCCRKCNNKRNNAKRYQKPAAKPPPPPPPAESKLTPEQKAAREAAIRALLKRRQLSPEEEGLRAAEQDFGMESSDNDQEE
jgi:hypothetical protein